MSTGHTTTVRDWAVARYLVSIHLPFLALVVAGIFVLSQLIAAGIAVFGTVTDSVWDPVMSILRWLGLGWGAYLTHRILPTVIAHGRTRREFGFEAIAFVLVAAAVLGAVVTAGYALESLLYGLVGWEQDISRERLFTSATDYPLVFVSSWALLAVWTITGTFLGAAFYREDGWALPAVPLAIALVVGLGVALGFNGLPVVGRLISVGHLSVGAAVALCAGAFAVGAATTLALVRDLPVRTRIG